MNTTSSSAWQRVTSVLWATLLALLVAGVMLLVTGLFVYRTRQIWLVIVGFGAVGTGVLGFDLLTAPPECLAHRSMPPGAQVCRGYSTRAV